MTFLTYAMITQITNTLLTSDISQTGDDERGILLYDIFDVAVFVCVKILPIDKCISVLNTLDMEGRSGDGGVPWIWRGGAGTAVFRRT